MLAALMTLTLLGSLQDEFPFEELGLLTGYARGSLDDDQDFEVVPLAFRVGIDLNPCLGLSQEGGHLQLGLELFFNSILEPEDRIEVGLDVFLRWRQPVLDGMAVFLEVGAGPMYFGLDTREQGHAGFNFLDQIGAGVQIWTGEATTLWVGYRWRHVSHAGLRDNRNSGIDANSVVIGFSVFY